MNFARERGEWFWVAYGPKALAMARDCAARARQLGNHGAAATWDRWVMVCAANPTKRLKIKLPPDYVERHMNKHKYFNAEPWWKGV